MRHVPFPQSLFSTITAYHYTEMAQDGDGVVPLPDPVNPVESEHIATNDDDIQNADLETTVFSPDRTIPTGSNATKPWDTYLIVNDVPITKIADPERASFLPPPKNESLHFQTRAYFPLYDYAYVHVKIFANLIDLPDPCIGKIALAVQNLNGADAVILEDEAALHALRQFNKDVKQRNIKVVKLTLKSSHVDSWFPASLDWC